MSKKARKKLECCFNWLLFNAKPKRTFDSHSGKYFTFKINLITLTLPSQQQHPDSEISSVCLNNFLNVLRKQGLKNYVWRAEAQPFTGNIHFHITTDMYFHYDSIRKWWNQSVNLLGYVDRFAAAHMHFNPNSTDVHSVKHVRKLSAYLSKYLAKNRAFPCIGDLRLIKGEQKEFLYGSDDYRKESPNRKEGKLIGHVLGGRIRSLECRLWGSSQGLSKCKSIVLDGQEHELKPVFDFVSMCDFSLVKRDFVDSYYGDVSKESEIWFPDLYRLMQQQFQTATASN